MYEARDPNPRFSPRKPRSPQAGFSLFALDETVFIQSRSCPETLPAYRRSIQTTGIDHVAAHSQRNLSSVFAGRSFRHFEPGSKAMTEIFAAFFSISVFLAHAFDVYRTR